jgi:hypothetical protein
MMTVPRSEIAPRMQASAHEPQSVQASASTTRAVGRARRAVAGGVWGMSAAAPAGAGEDSESCAGVGVD